MTRLYRRVSCQLSVVALWAALVGFHLMVAQAQAASDLRFAVGSAVGAPNSTVAIPVRVTRFTSINSFQFSFHWNPAVAQFVNVEQFAFENLTSGNFGTNFVSNGTLTVSWDDTTGASRNLADGATVFAVQLKLIAPSGSSGSLVIDGTPTMIEGVNYDLQVIPVTVLPGQVTINQANTPPSIVTQPQDQTAMVGGSASFTVTAGGTAPLSYQWCFNGLMLPGAKSATLTLTNVQAAKAGDYSVLVTNAWGAVASATVHLTVEIAADTAPPAILITSPTRAGSYSTSISPINLAGIATDNIKVKEVRHGNNRGGGGQANGTTNWTVTNVELQPGPNVVTVEAEDLSGNTRSSSLTVVYTPASSGGQPTFVVGNLIGAPGSIVSVPIQVSQFVDITSLQFVVHWDPAVAAFAGIGQLGSLPGLGIGNFGTTMTNQGLIILSWDDINGGAHTRPDGTVIFSVELRLSGSLGASSSVYIDGDPREVEVSQNFIPVPVVLVPGGVTIQQQGTPPVLAPIGNKSIGELSLLTFTASATDTDAPPQTLSFSLDAGAPAGASINAASGVFTWTPTEVQGPGSYPVTIRVTDNGSPAVSDFETITITVSEVNTPPLLGSIGNKTVQEATQLSFTAAATDSDIPTNSLFFSLDAGAPAGASINSSSGVFAWTPTIAQGPSNYTVTIRVTDNGSPPLNAFETITITVTDSNTAPVLGAIGNKSVIEGNTLSFTATATDTDVPTNTLTFSLDAGAPAGASINASSGLFTWMPTEAQGPSMNSVTIRVRDNGSPMREDFETITITVVETNAAPVLGVIGNRSIAEGNLLSFSATATDADVPTNTLTFSLGAGAPAGASINASSGLFNWTPTTAQGPSNYLVTIRVTDNGSPPLSDFETITISVTESNTAPVLGPIGNRTIFEGNSVSFTAMATDMDVPANTLTFSLDAGAPSGANINASSGAFTWTPSEGQGPSTNSITVRVRDNGFPPLEDFETITITVLETNAAPVLAAIGNKTIFEGVQLSFMAAASDADLPTNTLTFSLDAGAPSGATINASSGLFTWMPTEAQGPSVNTITIRVRDNGSPLLEDFETITITVLETNNAPVLGAIGNKSVTESNLLTFTASATDSDSPVQTLTFTLDAGAPAGANINASNGVFTWTPTEAQGPASHTVTIRVRDNGVPALEDFETITITVTESNLPPVLAPVGNKSINENSLLTFMVSATDPDLPMQELSFGLDAGAPAGASINASSGVFTWTPAEGQGPGTNTVTIRVTDSGSPARDDFETITIIVSEVNLPPVLAAIGNKAASEGNQLTFTATATDPDIPTNTLLFSLDAGAPAGAVIAAGSGVFTWTPTGPQGPSTNSVTIRVTDNGSPPLSDFETITIVVTDVNTPPTLGAIGNRTVTEGVLLTFTATATDADTPGQTLTYSLGVGAPSGASINASNGVFTWTPTEAQGPSINSVTIRVTDNGVPALEDFETITITVLETNAAPVLGTIGNRSIVEGNLLSFTATATDVDLPPNTLTFSLDAGAPAGASINASNGVFTWTPTEAQGPSVATVTFRVRDNGPSGLEDFETITITVLETNNAPVLAFIGDASVNEGNLLTFTVSGIDQDTPVQTLTYTLDAGAPVGANINPNTGVFTWTPSEGQGPSVYTLTIRVTDNGSPSKNDFETITITVDEVNLPPVLATIGNKTVPEGSLLSFTVSASDPDLPAQTLTYSLGSGSPAGVSINGSSGLFTWTPTEAQGPASYMVTIRVADNGSPATNDFETITITVTEANGPPVLEPIENRTITEGRLLSFTAVATDSDMPADSLTFSLDAAAPAGANIDPDTGVFTWTPTEAQGPSTNVIAIFVTDDGTPPLSAAQVFTVTVLETNNPPVLSSLSNYVAQVLVALRITNVVTDSDIPANQISFQLEEAPKGLRINRFTGLITWAPARNQARTTNYVTVVATDDCEPPLSASNRFMIIVDDYLELSIGTAVLRAGEIGAVPVNLLATTTPVTNISSSLTVASDRLGGLALATVAPELSPATLVPEGPNQHRMNFKTLPGQFLQQNRVLAQLNFTAISTQSAFVPVVISNIVAFRTNGVVVPRTLATSGRVVVVGTEPLLESLVSTNRERTLILYGEPGVDYIVQSTDDPGDSLSWQLAWQGRLTSLSQSIVPTTLGNDTTFFRAIRQSAPLGRTF